MGADYIGWRGCALQESLGSDGFLGKLKLRAYKKVLEEQVPPERRDLVKVTVAVTGRGERAIDYPTIVRELGEFERGIPECADCPLAGGSPIGCYRYVSYPIDAVTEELLFDYFLSKVDEHDSIPNQLWRDIVSQVGDDTGWHEQRGPDGALAELDAPFEASFEYQGEEHTVDSAQLLASLFLSLEQPPMLVAYALFFKQFGEYVRERVGLRDDGTLQLTIDGSDSPSRAEIERRSKAALDEAQRIVGARTFGEIDALAPMLLQAAVRCVEEGWKVVVDG